MAPRSSTELHRTQSTGENAMDMSARSAPPWLYTAYNPRLHGSRTTPETAISHPAHRDSPLESESTPPRFHACLFGSRDARDAFYHEPVAWANSTLFRGDTGTGTGTTTKTMTTMQDVVQLQLQPQLQPQPLLLLPSTCETRSAESVFLQQEHAQQGSTNPQPQPQPQPLPQYKKQYFRTARHIRLPWNPGFCPNFPAKGVVALIAVFTLTAACAGILVAAHGTRAEEWRVGGVHGEEVQPAVYLSVLEMCMDMLVFCALGQGVVVRFWRGVLRGCTIADIHDVYESAFVGAALRAMLRFRGNGVTTATLVAVLSTIRGPLFQRSLTLRHGIYHTNAIFAALGATLSLVSIIAILPLYHGYWDLGRRASLNPLETARAFGAPLLDGVEGNAGANDVQMERGHVAVKYGAVERLGREKVLRIENAKASSVRMPCEGEIFG